MKVGEEKANSGCGVLADDGLGVARISAAVGVSAGAFIMPDELEPARLQAVTSRISKVMTGDRTNRTKSTLFSTMIQRISLA
jgi:hypothetical protein